GAVDDERGGEAGEEDPADVREQPDARHGQRHAEVHRVAGEAVGTGRDDPARGSARDRTGAGAQAEGDRDEIEREPGGEHDAPRDGQSARRAAAGKAPGGGEVERETRPRQQDVDERRRKEDPRRVVGSAHETSGSVFSGSSPSSPTAFATTAASI